MTIDLNPWLAAFIVLVCAWVTLKIINRKDKED